MIKPRQYGEPIHEDAPGFNPTVHKDLVEELNEALDHIAPQQYTESVVARLDDSGPEWVNTEGLVVDGAVLRTPGWVYPMTADSAASFARLDNSTNGVPATFNAATGRIALRGNYNSSERTVLNTYQREKSGTYHLTVRFTSDEQGFRHAGAFLKLGPGASEVGIRIAFLDYAAVGPSCLQLAVFDGPRAWGDVKFPFPRPELNTDYIFDIEFDAAARTLGVSINGAPVGHYDIPSDAPYLADGFRLGAEAYGCEILLSDLRSGNAAAVLRSSPPLDLTGAGVIQASRISWNGSVSVEASVDGSSWLPCVNGQPIPGVLPGAVGGTLRLRQEFPIRGGTLEGLYAMVDGKRLSSTPPTGYPILLLDPDGLRAYAGPTLKSASETDFTATDPFRTGPLGRLEFAGANADLSATPQGWWVDGSGYSFNGRLRFSNGSTPNFAAFGGIGRASQFTFAARVTVTADFSGYDYRHAGLFIQTGDSITTGIRIAHLANKWVVTRYDNSREEQSGSIQFSNVGDTALTLGTPRLVTVTGDLAAGWVDVTVGSTFIGRFTNVSGFTAARLGFFGYGCEANWTDVRTGAESPVASRSLPPLDLTGTGFVQGVETLLDAHGVEFQVSTDEVNWVNITQLSALLPTGSPAPDRLYMRQEFNAAQDVAWLRNWRVTVLGLKMAAAPDGPAPDPTGGGTGGGGSGGGGGIGGIGPADASGDDYDYRLRTDEVQFYDRTLGVWRTLSQASSYTPGYLSIATFTSTFGSPIRRRGSISVIAPQARPDGRDIRVFLLNADGSLGEPQAHMISSVVGATITLSILVALNAGEAKRFAVTWGDPTAKAPVYTQEQYSDLLNAASNSAQGVGDYVVYQDPSQAYIPADFETAGTVIYGARDDIGEIRASPTGAPIRWNGISYTELGHNSNGGLEFGSVTSSRPSTAPNAIGWCQEDIYESWRREVILPDGFAWHILTGTGGYSANIRLTIRYFSSTGRWIVTMFQNAPASVRVNLRVNGTELVLASPTRPLLNDPATAFVVVIDSGALAATVTPATRFTGATPPGGGLIPITTDMIYAPGGSLQVQLRALTDGLAVAASESVAWFMGG